MRALAFVLVSLLVLAGAEAFARLYLGLGDPPLTIRDPAIDYLFAPSRCYSRFGNRVCYNRWSMRSPDFPLRKIDPKEHRILVLGNSVVNGGALTDQSEIATSLLADRLAASGEHVVVGNISAGSWGPANLLAYVTAYGWFDADTAVFVFSGRDLTDLPTFPKDLGPDFPLRTPFSALGEMVERYLPRYLSRILPRSTSDSTLQPAASSAEVARGSMILAELLQEAHASVKIVCVLYHADRAADTDLPSGRRADFARIAASAGVRFALIGEDSGDYRDDIHPNAAGQAKLATVIQHACL
jgi:hypothetical protein